MRAEAFVMPFGKNRGRTIGDLAKRPHGRGYLEWLAANVEGNAGKAAELVLAAVQAEGKPA